MKEIIGSFIIDENGELAALQLPELLMEPMKPVSKTLYHFTQVIKATRSVESLTIDSENARLISLPSHGRVLVVIAEKDLNERLFRIMSSLALSDIRDAPTPLPKNEASEMRYPTATDTDSFVPMRLLDGALMEGAQVNFTLIDRFGRIIDSKRTIPLERVGPGDTLEFNLVRTIKQKINVARYRIKEVGEKTGGRDEEPFDLNKLCELYDKIFGVVAKRVENLIGNKSGSRFRAGASDVLEKNPGLFEGVEFEGSGKPDMDRVRKNAVQVFNREELMQSLDGMLLSMLETLKKIGGPKQEQKALKTLDKMLKEMREAGGQKDDVLAIDSIQKIKLERTA